MAYQKIEPKVGEKYRVIKYFGNTWRGFGEVGDVIICTQSKPGNQKFRREDSEKEAYTTREGSNKLLTSEFLEIVKEPEPFFDTKNIQILCNASHEYYMNEAMLKISKYTATNYKQEPKQTIMNKLTSALKRALSKEKQTLYKVGLITSGLDLSATGREAYLNALFQNEGDHAKAMAEMVEMAEEELKENED